MSRNRSAQKAPLRALRENQPPAAAHSDQRARLLYVSLALCALTVLVFAQTVHFDFINFDDDKYVWANPAVQKGLTGEGLAYAFQTYAPNWHPLTWLSHMLDSQLFGLDAGWHHQTNILLHTVNVVLLLLLLLRLTGAFWRSALVAALFAVHPLHVESVAWVAERKDLLSCLFWLLTMWMYVAYVRGPDQKKNYRLALFFFLLAAMSKPTVVTLPFALLLVDYWPLQRLSWASLGALLKEKIPFFFVAGTLSVITYVGQKHGNAMREASRLAAGMRVRNVLLSYSLYLRDLVWPRSLGVLYPFPRAIPGAAVLLSVTILAVITALVLWQARKAPYLPMGWFWYLGVLVPMIGIVQVGAQTRADRYTYIPAIGFFILITWGAFAVATRYSVSRHALAAISATILAVLAVRCWIQVSYWRDPESLYTRTIAITDRNAVIKTNLGAALDKKHRPQEAERWFRSALADDSDCDECYTNLGINLIEQTHWREAVDILGQDLRLNPKNALAIYNRAVALNQLDRVPESIQGFRDALQYGLPPQYAAAAHESLGQLWLMTGQNQAALDELETALSTQPDMLEARINRALAWIALGRRQEAALELARLRQANPRDVHILQAWQYVHGLIAPGTNQQAQGGGGGK